MRNFSPHHITSTQMMYIITGAQVGSAMLSLPSLICRDAGQNGWMAFLPAALVSLISLFLIERLGRSLPGHNFVQLNQVLLGKVGGAAGVVIFVLYAVFFEMILVSGFARLINMFLLPRTPLWAAILLAMICVVYAGSKGGTVIGRINETLFFGIILSTIVIVIPVFYGADYTNLLPLGEVEIRGMLKASWTALYAFAGTEVLLVFYSQVADPERIWRSGVKATVISLIIYIIAAVACILVFGSDCILKYVWPGVTILKVVNIAVIERLEFYFLAIWVGVVLRRVFNLSFAAALSLAQLFKKENRHGIAMLAVGICIYFAALMPQNIAVNKVLVAYAVGSYLLAGVFYPLVLLGVLWTRKGLVGRNA